MSTDRIVLATVLLAAITGCPGSLENKEDFLAGGGASASSNGSNGSNGSTGSGEDDPGCDGLLTTSCARSNCSWPTPPRAGSPAPPRRSPSTSRPS